MSHNKWNSRPHSTTKDLTQDNYLWISRKQPSRVLVLTVVFLVTLLAWYIWKQLSIEINFSKLAHADISTQLGLALGGFTLAIVYFFLLRSLFTETKSYKREQRFYSLRHLFHNVLGVIWMGLALAIIAINVYPEFFPHGYHQAPNLSWFNKFEYWVMAFMVIVFFLLFLYIFYKLLINFIKYLKHGTPVAKFNQTSYKAGSTIKMSMVDRQSNNAALSYRVHLNLVEIHKKTTGSGKNRSVQWIRHYLYDDHQDVNPLNLKQGIQFVLPENIPSLADMSTSLEQRNKPRFWEVLVEEIDGYFFAGFHIEVK